MRGVWIYPVIFQILFFPAKSDGFGARAAGMANAYAAFSGDVWTLFHNPGGLYGLSSLQAGASYTPGLFNLSELGITAFAFGMPAPAGRFGCALKKYGCPLYNEITCGATYASAVSDFHFGLTCWYHNVNISGYGSAGAIIIDAGFLVKILPGLDIGLTLRNVSASAIGEVKEKLPQTVVSGAAYRPVKNLTITADLEKETMFPPAFRCGLEYCPTDACELRAGIAGEAVHYSGGIGIIVSAFRFDYGVTVHRLLGLTHVFSVTFLRREK